MSIDKRIDSVTQKLKDWFAKAQKTFPEPTPELKPAVSVEYQYELRGILSQLDAVVARLKAEGQLVLCQRLKDALKRQEYFYFNISGNVEDYTYPITLHNSLIDVLKQCSDYFKPVELYRHPINTPKQVRAQIETLIRSLLDWANKQPEYTTGKDPDRDRILNPVDKLKLARLADQAKIFLQNEPGHSELESFWNFVNAMSQNSVNATLISVTKLLDDLCECRNALSCGEQKDEPQQISDGNAGYMPNPQEKTAHLKPTRASKRGADHQTQPETHITTVTDDRRIELIDDFCSCTERLINYIRHPDESREVSKAKVDMLGEQVNDLARKIWPQINSEQSSWPYQSTDICECENLSGEGVFGIPPEHKEQMIERLQQWKDRALKEKSKLQEKLALQTKQEGFLEPKPPESLQKLLWIRQHWRKHWKLMLLAIAILLIPSIFVLPKFDLFSKIYTLIKTNFP